MCFLIFSYKATVRKSFSVSQILVKSATQWIRSYSDRFCPLISFMVTSNWQINSGALQVHKRYVLRSCRFYLAHLYWILVILDPFLGSLSSASDFSSHCVSIPSELNARSQPTKRRRRCVASDWLQPQQPQRELPREWSNEGSADRNRRRKSPVVNSLYRIKAHFTRRQAGGRTATAEARQRSAQHGNVAAAAAAAAWGRIKKEPVNTDGGYSIFVVDSVSRWPFVVSRSSSSSSRIGCAVCALQSSGGWPLPPKKRERERKTEGENKRITVDVFTSAIGSAERRNYKSSFK